MSRPVSSGASATARYERYALIFAPGQSRLGSEALGLVERGIDPLYASDVDEAHLLALQETGRVGALVVPGDLPLAMIDVLIDRIAPQLWAGPAAIVVVGPPDDREFLRQLKDRLLSWVLREPYDAAEFRFVVAAALSTEDKLESRAGLRVPISQPVRVTTAGRPEAGFIRNLSIGGAYIALDVPPTPGTRIQVACQLGPQALATEAVVVYCQTPGLTGRAVRESGMGVAFRNLDDAARSALAVFVDERTRSFKL
jgi:PilZ domain